MFSCFASVAPSWKISLAIGDSTGSGSEIMNEPVYHIYCHRVAMFLPVRPQRGDRLTSFHFLLALLMVQVKCLLYIGNTRKRHRYSEMVCHLWVEVSDAHFTITRNEVPGRVITTGRCFDVFVLCREYSPCL